MFRSQQQIIETQLPGVVGKPVTFAGSYQRVDRIADVSGNRHREAKHAHQCQLLAARDPTVKLTQKRNLDWRIEYSLNAIKCFPHLLEINECRTQQPLDDLIDITRDQILY